MRPAIAAVAAMTLAGCQREAEPEPRHGSVALPETAVTDTTQGQAVYVQSCLLCHQHDGGGVPNMHPSLVKNPLVAGEPEALIRLVLHGVGGPAPALPASGEYAMVMPASAHLTDRQIADVLTYIRQAFDQAGPITPEQVGAVRAQPE